MTDPEQLLRETLAERAPTDPDHTAYADVLAGARSLRRRRRVTAGVASVAAVAAVLVPVAVVVARPGAVEPAPATSTRTPPAPTSDTSFARYPVGEPPRIAYVDDHDYVAPDGTRTRLHVGKGVGVTGVTPYAGGFLVTDDRFFEGTVGLQRLDADGRSIGAFCSAGTPVVNADGSGVAWTALSSCDGPLDADSGLHLANADGTDEIVQALDPDRPVTPRPVGFVGDNVVYADTYRDGGYVTDGIAPIRPLESVRRLVDADPMSGLVAGRADGGGVVVDGTTGEVVARFPDEQLGRLSPGGQYVTARPDVHTLGGSTSVEIFDAHTGSPITSALGGGMVGLSPEDVAWEDGEHLLVVAGGLNGTSAIVRVDLDGHVERVTDVSDASYVLAATP